MLNECKFAVADERVKCFESQGKQMNIMISRVETQQESKQGNDGSFQDYPWRSGDDEIQIGKVKVELTPPLS